MSDEARKALIDGLNEDLRGEFGKDALQKRGIDLHEHRSREGMEGSSRRLVK